MIQSARADSGRICVLVMALIEQDSFVYCKKKARNQSANDPEDAEDDGISVYQNLCFRSGHGEEERKASGGVQPFSNSKLRY